MGPGFFFGRSRMDPSELSGRKRIPTPFSPPSVWKPRFRVLKLHYPAPS